jgi:hypothetical protein
MMTPLVKLQVRVLQCTCTSSRRWHCHLVPDGTCVVPTSDALVYVSSVGLFVNDKGRIDSEERKLFPALCDTK